MIKRSIFLLSTLLAFVQAQAQYNINITIEGLSDTTVLLGNFYGESTYVKDTAQTDSNGTLQFQSDRNLEKGTYFIVLGKNRLFDIVIGDDQAFSLKTKMPDYAENMVVEGDLDNRVYFDDIKFNVAQNAMARPYVETMRDSTASSEAKAEAREVLTKLNEEVTAHQQQIIEKHPQTITAKMHRANKNIDVPEAPAGVDEQQYKYEYYKAHYWDDFDLSDPVMLRLPNPIYKEKYNTYLDKLVYQHPDSLIKEIDALVAQAKSNEDTYKYAVWSAVIKYQYPEIMGLDEVYVHLYDKYFASGEMDFWANEQLKKNLKDRADQLRNSLIGKPAPNLIMLDKDLKRKSLYDITSDYTVIYFFDPDCGHCKKETPKLVDFYNETTFDVEVFAVSADTSMVKMKKYIDDMNMNWITVNGPRTITEPYQKLYDAMTTPTIYILDKDKKIIAKKLPADRLDEFLTRYESLETKNKPQND